MISHQRARLARALVLVSLLAGHEASAHGPVNEQVAELNARIAKQPNDASLYLARARLHMADEHWRQSVGDLRRALAKNPGLVGAYYFLGQAQLARGRTRAAVNAAGRFLSVIKDKNAGGRFRGHMLLAQAHEERKAYQAALSAYTAGFKTAREARPEHYLGHARVLAKLRRFDDALSVLEDGLDHLGPIRSLQLKSLELLQASGRSQQRLQLLSTLVAAEPNNWDWQRQMAAQQLDMGDIEAAVANYEGALRQIGALPSTRRKARAIQSARRDIEAKLALARRRLEASPEAG